MRKILTLLVLASLSLSVIPLSLSASTLQFGENYSLRKGDSISGDLYVFGGNTTIAGDVLGDLVSFGSSVFVGGNAVSGGALVFADSGHVVSEIKKDLRGVGRKFVVSSSVGEDVALAGWSVQVLPQSVIGGDLLVVAGDVEVLGKVEGAIRIAGGNVFINSSVLGDISIVADSVSFGPNAHLAGSVSYSASQEATIDPNAQFEKGLDFTQINTRTRAEKFLPTVWGTWLIINFVILLLSALIVHGILRKISERFVVVSITEFGWSVLRGFLFVVGIPVAAFVGFLTFIAIPFSLFSLALYCFGLLLTLIYMPILTGSLIYKLLHRDRPVTVTWKTILVGVTVSIVLKYIPFIGSFAWYILFLAALGGIYQVLFDKFREVR